MADQTSTWWFSCTSVHTSSTSTASPPCTTAATGSVLFCLRLYLIRCLHAGYWCQGILVSRDTGVRGYWCRGVWVSRDTGVKGYWHQGILVSRRMGVRGYWCQGILVSRGIMVLGNTDVRG